MKKREYLKTKNISIIVIFIIWCISVYVTFFTGFESFWSELQTKYADLNRKEGLVVALMPILVVILSGIISSELKARFIFWRLRHALPGHRVFSKLAPQDARIDMEYLRNKIDAISDDPKTQNTFWYRLYRNYEDAPTVKHAHRNFLLARDLSTISLIFAIFGTIGLIFGSVRFQALSIYFLVMLAHYIILAVVAQNHGNRFVCNVITEYLADD